MMNNQNSRRNFLSSIAILSAGTVIAGSPAKLFSSGEDEMNPEEAWKTYMKNAGASVCLNVAGLELPVTSTEVKGHLVKRGRIVSFEKENLLAQPAWIYWGSNTTKPADVLINVYENKYPYKRLTTINRYELNALAQVSKKNAGENLLLASCVKNNIENKQLRRLRIHTKINKRKLSQDISFYKNDSIILKEQLFYSA